MIKYANIQKRRETLSLLYLVKTKQYPNLVVRFKNTNLCLINELVGKTIFYKNDIFVDAITLYEIMQPVGGKGKKHNYHGLNPETILDGLRNINVPLCILNDGKSKYSIIIPTKDENGNQLLVVIETACQINGGDSNVNKLVTVFPKEKVFKYLRSFDIEDVVYLNQIELDKIK